MTSTPPSDSGGRTVHASLLLLSFGSGAADAFAFLALGGIFTANMTGNLILSGMFTRPEFLQTFIGSLTAILAFAAFLYLGFRLTSAHRVPTNSPRATTWTHLLIGSIVLQTIVVLVWVAGWATAPNGQILAVALASAALALQTVAARRLSDRSGVTTTYVTGTLTSTMQSLAERSSSGQFIRVLSILMLPLGAVCETVVIASAKWAGPMLPWAVAIAAAAALVIAGRVVRSA